MNELKDHAYEHFREFIENSRDILYKQDIKTRGIVYFSKSSAVILGYTSEEISAMSYEESLKLFHPEDLKSLRNFTDDLIKADTEGKMPLEREFRMLTKEGNIVWIHGYYNLKRSKSGEPEFILGVLKNNNERKKNELKLKASEEKFRMIYEYAPVMIDSFDKNGRCLLWNNECVKQLGYTFREITESEDPLRLAYPDDKIKQKVFNDILKSDGKFREYEVKSKHGEIRIQRWANFSLPDSSIISVGYDITESNKYQKELKDSEEMLSQIFQTTPDPITIIRADDGICSYVNSKFTEITGWKKEETIGKTASEIDIWNDYEKRELFIAEIMEKGYVDSLQADFKSKDNRIFTGLISGKLIKVGNQPLIITVTKDISERIKVEKELKKYREKLEQLVAERTRELEEKNKELKRYNKLFEGREFRIKELRDEVKKLKKILRENNIDSAEIV